MDRGFIDFERLSRFDAAGAFFVTRAKSNLRFQRLDAKPVDKTTGLIGNQRILLTVFYSQQGYRGSWEQEHDGQEANRDRRRLWRALG